MKLTLAIARTRPSPTDVLRLRDRIETLLARRPRFLSCFRPSWPCAFDADMVQMNHYLQPLPTLRLPDGSIPYECGWASCSIALDGADDSRLAPLWHAASGLPRTRTSWVLLCGASDQFRSLSLWIEVHKWPEPGTGIIRLSFTEPEEGGDPVGQFYQAARVPRRYWPNLPRRKGLSMTRGLHAMTVTLPADPSLLGRVLKAVQSLGWGQPSMLAESWFTCMADPDDYASLPDRFHPITRRWTCSFVKGYRPNFDPFLPPDPTSALTYRFPVAYRDAALSDAERTTQLVMVHGPSGSFLEILAARGRKEVIKLAMLADVEDDLEFWSGAPEDRWGG